jgi:acetolactate synthase I/II/III large subunit
LSTGRVSARRNSLQTPSQHVAAALVGALSDAGTRFVFGVPGGGPNLDVVGAAADAGMSFILTHTETAAAIMAATYADISGTPGALVVTRGPGLASAVNGVAHAALDRLPLVAIADTVPEDSRDHISHQLLDQTALAGSIAKAAVTAGATHAEQTAAHIVRVATELPAGPVVVNFDPGARDACPGDMTPLRRADDLAPLFDVLSAARRPVVILGLGALTEADALRASLVGSGVPVLQTYRARGIVPDSATEAAGLVTGGTMEFPLLDAADLIVGIGVDPVEFIPAKWNYDAPTVLISAVPTDTARYFKPSAEFITPLIETVRLLRILGAQHTWPPGSGQAAKALLVDLLCQAPPSAPGSLTPQDVVTTIRRLAPSDTIAAVDAGAHMLVAMPLWPVEEPHHLLSSSGLATMGFALPAAIAAALCRPNVPVIAFTGDGGLGMVLMEIETAVRHRLRVVIVVFNDATLSLIKIKQHPTGQGGSRAVDYGRASFAGVATALGAAAATVTNKAELAAALTAALKHQGPTLIDAQVDPADYPAIMDLSRGDSGRRASRN